MKTKYLFPYYFQRIGWILLGIGLALFLWIELFDNIHFLENVLVFAIYDSGMPFSGSGTLFLQFITDNIQYELFTILSTIGFIFIGFSKRKSEDEYTLKLRLESLLWATYIIFAIFLFAVIFIYGINFLYIPQFSLLAFLVVFNIRFYFVLFKEKKAIGNEE